jgi:uncharacterized protein (TIGR02246 family)
MPRRSLLLLCAGLVLLPACRSRPTGASPGLRTLSDRDRSAILALDTAFVHAWLRDDTAGVLALFHPDAVLLPPGGRPVQGVRAIRAYWWPDDGSHTRITAFTRELAEVQGTPDLAWFRGDAALGWVYAKNGKEASQTSRSTDLVLLAPDSAGGWRIIRQMWSPAPAR